VWSLDDLVHCKKQPSTLGKDISGYSHSSDDEFLE
jgi:hypothetical protein